MKPRTVIIDIDGVLLRHHEDGPSRQWCGEQEVLPGARLFLDHLEMDASHIVLMTARPEVHRDNLMDVLSRMGLVYHQLVMGVTSGERVLVNDKKQGSRAATAYEFPRNGDPRQSWETATRLTRESES